MPFVKGKSGNPSGRPKVLLPDGRSLTDIAKAHTDDAIDTLVEVMHDDEAPHAARVSAATSILDRGWGRPKQEISGEFEIIDLSDVISRRRQNVEEEHGVTAH